MRKTIKLSLWIVSFSVMTLCIADFCHSKTKGFQRQRIAPAFSPPAAVHKFSTLSHQELLAILNQPFSYLKKGRSSYVFVSADQKYVLKFLRNPSISPLWWSSCALSQKLAPNFCQKERQQKQKRKEKQENSYLLAFDQIPSQTAILCLHLYTSSSLQKCLTIYDAIGIEHKIPMDETAFILQKKAAPFSPYFQMLYKENKFEEIQALIQQFAMLLKERTSVGICDYDLSPYYNLGIINGKLITFDLDSLTSVTPVVTSEDRKSHMERDAKKMKTYLRSISPELEHILEDEIQRLSFLF